jgi:hypothetical protein
MSKHVPVELSHDPVARLPLAPLEGLLDRGVAQPVETPLHQTCVRERYFLLKVTQKVMTHQPANLSFVSDSLSLFFIVKNILEACGGHEEEKFLKK